MKKSGGGKSADIRSFFTALSSKPPSAKSKEETKTAGQGAGASTKRKVKPVVESDEEDFAPVKEELQNGSSSSSSKKSKAAASPVKKDKPSSSDSKSRRETSKDKKDERSQSKEKGRRNEAEKSKAKAESPVSSKSSSPVKAKKEAETNGKRTEEKPRKKAGTSPEKPTKSSKSKSLEKVKHEETVKESPSGGKKRRAKALIESDEDEDEIASPMPPPSRKKSKGARYELNVTPTAKRKDSAASETSPKKGTPGDTPTKTPDEKKKQSAAAYFKFLSRAPPKNLGAKEIPEGAPDCFANQTFVLTGVLPSFERDDIADAIKNHGGRVTSGVSKKTSYVVVGDEPGASKTKKAQELGIPMITEDDILDMLRKSNPNPPAESMEIEEERPEQPGDISLFENSVVEEPPSTKLSTPKKKGLEDFHEFDSDLETPPKVRARRAGSKADIVTTPSRKESPSKKEPEARKSLKFSDSTSSIKTKAEPSPIKSVKKEPEPSPAKAKKAAAEPSTSKRTPSKSPAKAPVPTQKPVPIQTQTPVAKAPAPPPAVVPTGPQLMWVDKYKPTTLKQIVGQTGDASNAKKLLKWLQNWFNYHGSADDKAKASWPGLRDPEGKTFKAALLSGPPGIGKTTTAHLCCKEIGIDYIELNASDQRNKSGLKMGFSDSLTNVSIASHANGNKTTNTAGRRHVLIMDEVDGMSGNEDRGGMQELIQLIKTSRIPIICICNDRQHQKIRSLANYCFDLRFTKPRFEQLKGFVQSICFKEKIKVPPEMMQQLIKSTDQDVRQILHQLQLFKEAKDKSSYDPRKDLHLGPWEVARKVFSKQEHQGMYINDKQSLFFHDYSLGPLFVYENYLRSQPAAANGDPYKTMDLVRAAAESLATGDRVEKIIRSKNNWSLLPTQAIFASVLPGEYMEGNSMSGIDFPQWLGKNSNRNKRARMLQELHTHMHLQISGSAEALNMDYLPYLRRAIVNPLARGEPEVAAQYMHDYCLLREDIESLTELAVWPNMKDRFENVDSKTKAAFTRLVNKEAFVPYSVVKITKGKGKGAGAGGEDELEGLDGEEAVKDEEEEDEDVEKDAMIKVKKPRGKAGAKAGTSKSSGKSKGKGKGGADMEIDDDSDDEDVKPKGKGRKGVASSSKSRKK